jgi:hypothetical protein
VRLLVFDLAIREQKDLAVPFAQLHQRTVADNRGQPGTHQRLSSELVDMPVSGQQSFMRRILRIGCIAQKSQSTPIMRGQAE